MDRTGNEGDGAGERDDGVGEDREKKWVNEKGFER